MGTYRACSANSQASDMSDMSGSRHRAPGDQAAAVGLCCRFTGQTHNTPNSAGNEEPMKTQVESEQGEE